MLGHGFNNFWDRNYIDPNAIPIPKACFQLGVANESNRKGVLEMEEECEKSILYLLVPDSYYITSWLSERPERENNQTSSSRAKKTKRNKAERKQKNTAAISQKHHQYLKTQNQQSKNLWDTKYLGILLEYT